MASRQSHEPVPLWLREPWPVALALASVALLWLAVAERSPLDRFDLEWTGVLLRSRLALGLTPRPDPKIFLVGLEKDDFERWPSIAAEYRAYAEIIEMTTDLGAAATAFDLILARGGPAEAEPVLAAVRASGRAVIFAEAMAGGGRDTLRAFPFAPPQVAGGLINLRPDPDEVNRGYAYAALAPDGGPCRASLALALHLAAQGALADLRCRAPETAYWPELAPDRKSLVENAIPMSVAFINFRSSFSEPWDKGFKYASLRDLRQKYAGWKQRGGSAAVPADLPGPGSLVIVGSVTPGSGDAGPTPFGVNEPKVQLHAAALSDLLQGEMLRAVGKPWLLAIVAALMALLAVIGRRIRGYRGLALLWLTLCAAPVLLAAAALIEWRVVLPAITPAALGTLAFLAEAGRRSALSTLGQIRMHATMAMYFSPRILEEVLANPGVMEPREAEVTVLATDLRNFTTITERFGTRVVFDLMNQVFEIQTRAVIATNGSMEHFLGDQFMAYWGAPQQQADAPDLAMKAARAIIEGLDELRRKLPPELEALFGFGVGVHRGKALVGNKGSRFRFDYGILGDIVNTVARVESLTKLYGVRWIVTQPILAALDPAPPHRFLDRVRVKGRENSVELIEIAIVPNPAWQAMATQYEAAWQTYQAGDFAAAQAAFTRIASEYQDPASEALSARCALLAPAPPDGWNGAYQLDAK